MIVQPSDAQNSSFQLVFGRFKRKRERGRHGLCIKGLSRTPKFAQKEPQSVFKVHELMHAPKENKIAEKPFSGAARAIEGKTNLQNTIWLKDKVLEIFLVQLEMSN